MRYEIWFWSALIAWGAGSAVFVPLVLLTRFPTWSLAAWAVIAIAYTKIYPFPFHELSDTIIAGKPE